jgi:biopolymer transport protein ExbB/TolQ
LNESAYSDARVLAAVQSALAGAERNMHAELRRRLRALATIASTAPLVGLLGTVMGIDSAFKGCVAPPWVCYTATLNGLSEALASTALGLLVAVPACWAYNYFNGRLQNFDLEAAVASSEITNYAAIRLSKRRRIRPRD